jgi:hypothetical protein
LGKAKEAIMNAPQCIRSAIRWLATGVGLAAGAYATYVGTTWCRYGNARHVASREDADPLLDRFMLECDVVERHHVRVAAPAQITLAAACDIDLLRSTIVRGIFNVRELILGSQPEETVLPQGLLAQVKALGWGVLAEIPGREIVFGAVTQPWMANVVFRALPADEFGAFHEPGYVKIIWTLRADPISAAESVARTETRVVTTDPTARAKFRWYWSFLSPGIVLIRRVSLRLVKAEAERRAREAGPEHRTAELLR